MKNRLLLRLLVIAIVGIATNLYASDDFQSEIETPKFLPNRHIQDQTIIEQVESHSQSSQLNTLNDDDYLSQLVDEIKLHICQFLSVKDIKQLGRVNTIWRRVPYTAFKIRYLQFAYRQNPHFNGYLSDVHYKFISAIIEKRFEFQMFESMRYNHCLVITDDGLVTTKKLPKYSNNINLFFTCESADKNVLGGCSQLERESDFTPIIHRISTRDTIQLTAHDNPFDGEIIGLNFDGSMAVGCKFENCNCPYAFIWQQGQNIKSLITSKQYPHSGAHDLNHNGSIIVGSAEGESYDTNRACVWIDTNYFYDMNGLLKRYGSPQLREILKTFRLCKINKLSKNSIAMLGIARRINHYDGDNSPVFKLVFH